MNDLCIASIWQRLQRVRALAIQCRSRLQTGWNGKGEGRVKVDSPSADAILFSESGYWHSARGARLPFRNTYRWTLIDDHIALEHLRFGAERPVFLLDLIATTGHLRAAIPHRCNDDFYDAQLSVEENALLLAWTVRGPNKDESLLYSYR